MDQAAWTRGATPTRSPMKRLLRRVARGRCLGWSTTIRRPHAGHKPAVPSRLAAERSAGSGGRSGECQSRVIEDTAEGRRKAEPSRLDHLRDVGGGGGGGPGASGPPVFLSFDTKAGRTWKGLAEGAQLYNLLRAIPFNPMGHRCEEDDFLPQPRRVGDVRHAPAARRAAPRRGRSRASAREDARHGDEAQRRRPGVRPASVVGARFSFAR